MAAGIPAVRHGKRQARLGYRMDRKPLLCQCGIHRAHAVLEQGLYGAGLPAHITWAGTDQRTASFLYSTRPFGRLGRDWLCSGFVLPGTTAPMFRKQFRLDALPARAKLFFCGLGYHEVYLNGRKVGDQRLSPAWTDYRRRVNYVVYDLLPYLRSGENVIGVMLGAGWYSNEESKPRPCFTAQLHLTMPDGTQQIRRTCVQDGWQCCKTPFLTQASIYIGERMVARLEEPGWTEPDFVSRLEWGPGAGIGTARRPARSDACRADPRSQLPCSLQCPAAAVRRGGRGFRTESGGCCTASDARAYTRDMRHAAIFRGHNAGW